MAENCASFYTSINGGRTFKSMTPGCSEDNLAPCTIYPVNSSSSSVKGGGGIQFHPTQSWPLAIPRGRSNGAATAIDTSTIGSMLLVVPYQPRFATVCKSHVLFVGFLLVIPAWLVQCGLLQCRIVALQDPHLSNVNNSLRSHPPRSRRLLLHIPH
jgi:hypothetical protein